MNPPKMTHAERTARMQAKQLALLRFLSAGEVYTSTDVSADLLECSRPAALATLKQLEKLGAIKTEEHLVQSRLCRIHGLSPHGAAMAGEFDAPTFDLGRTNSSWITHRLDCQRMRIKAERAGWREWQTERTLQKRGLKKVPDACAINPAGHRIAVEIERNVKSAKRLADVIAAYLESVKKGEFDLIHYVCPPGTERLVAGAFSRIKSVRHGGSIVTLTDNHRARFKFYSFENWIGETSNG